MGNSTQCTCSGTLRDKIRNWYIVSYRCSYSAFNGYKYAPSDYSLISCVKCTGMWRSKAAYVNKLQALNTASSLLLKDIKNIKSSDNASRSRAAK